MAENSKRRKRIILILFAGLTVLILMFFAVRRQAPVVQVVTPTREDLNASIASNGKVEPVSPTVARAEFATFVDKVTATEGQAVRRGQTILALDAAEVRSQLAQARADLIAAQTDLRNARSGGPPDEVAQLDGDIRQAQVQVASLERTHRALQDLAAKQAATQDELAQNEAALTKARAQLQALDQKREALSQRASVNVESAGLRVKQEEEQVRSQEEKARSATVIAPTDGTLYSLPVRAGDYVKVGDVLAEMADLRHVQVLAFVDEPDLGSLESNQDVQVTWDAKPGRLWKGRVEQVPKQVVAHGMRSVGEVLCSVENTNLDLLPNINVEIQILVRARRGALVIPRAAVRYDKEKHYVFIVAGGKAYRREITVGVSSASKYEVLSGLTANDHVALPGDRQLRDGMEVRAEEAN